MTAAAARQPSRAFAIGLARAAGGALVFGLPMLMTMEMWHLGFSVDRLRLAVLLLATLPLLVGVSHIAGFEHTFDAVEDLRDTAIAIAIAVAVAAAVLALFGVLKPDMPAGNIVGKIALQAVPASIGALLARSLMGGSGRDEEAGERRQTYAGELLLMAAGALFLALNVAPTEEIVLISYQMSPWHSLALALVSLLVMHAFVYAVEFHGQEQVPEEATLWGVVVRFTLTGYALALSISLFLLWVFGRTEGADLAATIAAMIVLGFPASVGAAAARLIL